MRMLVPTLTLVALIAATGLPQAVGQEGKPPPAAVEVAAAVKRDIRRGQEFVATVTPSRESTVGSQVEGLVTEKLVDAGDRVEAGKPLARLRTKTLELLIAAGKATLQTARHELEELEHGARPQELEQARSDLRAAEAESDLHQWRLKSVKELFDKGQVSEDEYQLALSSCRRAEEALERAKVTLAMLEEGPRKERVERARAHLRVQEAEVELLEDRLERHTIRAPFDGFVVSVEIEVGEWVEKGAEVCEMAALDEVDVMVPVVEDRVAGVTVGDAAPVRIEAVGGRVFEGTVAEVIPRGDPATRTFPVKVRVKNAPNGGGVLIKAGMHARVTLAVGHVEGAMLVHKDALVLGGRSPIVYVVDAKGDAPGTVRLVPVTVGVADGSLVQVDGDIESGALVVVKGNERLRPGQDVRITRTHGE